MMVSRYYLRKIARYEKFLFIKMRVSIFLLIFRGIDELLNKNSFSFFLQNYFVGVIAFLFAVSGQNTLGQYASNNDASSTSTPSSPTAFSGGAPPISGNPFRPSPETVKPDSRTLFPLLRNRNPFESSNLFPTQQPTPYGINPAGPAYNPIADYPRQQPLYNRIASLLPQHGSGYPFGGNPGNSGMFNRLPYYPASGSSGYPMDYGSSQPYYPSYQQQPISNFVDPTYYNRDCPPSVSPSYAPQTDDLRFNPIVFGGLAKSPYLTGDPQQPFGGGKPLFQPANVYPDTNNPGIRY